MFVFIDELDNLENIVDTIIFDDIPPFFSEDNIMEITETILHLMDEFMSNNPNVISEPDFNNILLEEIKEFLYIQLEQSIFEDDCEEEDIDEIVEHAFTIFTSSFLPERSTNTEPIIIEINTSNTSNTSNIDICTNNVIDNSIQEPIFEENPIQKIPLNEKPIQETPFEQIIEEKINKLRAIPQPVQRTPEWYQFRWNLITASNAYKALESQSSINQLIYEKCQPIKTIDETEEIKMVNTNTPMHWGQKYEPLSVLLYEHMFNTKVEDFGCIQHPTYKFLGASPDGINAHKDSPRYGRMLEIKNVVSREINGIPKKEYWIQMQLQMEVCDLDDCDFLETKFTEYPDYTTYYNDTNTEHIKKGSIIYFHTKEGAPFYKYKPVEMIDPEQINVWEEETINLYQSEPYNYIYLKFIYWKLEVLSCVLVQRNRDWFKNNIPQIEKVWKIIEEERVTGYEHRAPVKKQKKDYPSVKPYFEQQSQGCLLTFKKIIKLD